LHIFNFVSDGPALDEKRFDEEEEDSHLTANEEEREEQTKCFYKGYSSDEYLKSKCIKVDVLNHSSQFNVLRGSKNKENRKILLILIRIQG
jgi:hypothetical protein